MFPLLPPPPPPPQVYLLQNEDDLVDKWYAEEGSVLLMSSRKFINMVLVPMGKGAPKRRGKSHGISTQNALDERADGGAGAGGDHTAEVETAAATARRLRQQEVSASSTQAAGGVEFLSCMVRIEARQNGANVVRQGATLWLEWSTLFLCDLTEKACVMKLGDGAY